MKGDILCAVLNAIGDTVVTAGDLCTVFLEMPHGTGIGGFEYALRQKERKRERRNLHREEERKVRERYARLVYALKRDGLIEKREDPHRGVIVSLTKKGKEKRAELARRKKAMLPAPRYEAESQKTLVIITFDVPEKERRKRDWLREVLKNFGCTMIQKSVWVGNIKIPESFLQDLAKLHLVACVEIFEVTKSGSLKHVV